MNKLLKLAGITIALTIVGAIIRAINKEDKDFILTQKDLKELYKSI